MRFAYGLQKSSHVPFHKRNERQRNRQTTGDGRTAVNEFLKRFRDCGELSYPLPEEVTSEFIEGVLYRKAGNPFNSDLYRDFDEEEVHRALTRKGETLKHLWKK